MPNTRLVQTAFFMDYQIQVARRVEDIGQPAWDYLSHEQPFTSYQWYRFAEHSLANETSQYLIISRDHEPLARATFWVVSRDFLPVSSPILRTLIAATLRRWPLLVCRAPLTSRSGLVMPANADLHDSILGAVTRGAQELMRTWHASAGLFDYLDQAEMDWPGWPGAWRTTSFSRPGTCLNIAWTSFEAYLHHLSKSMQKDYRRHRNRAADLGISVAVDQSPPPAADALRLIRNVERHHGSSANPLTNTLLHTPEMNGSWWLKATIGDRLVGCGLLLGEKDARFLALLGLDYEVQYVYFQLFYAAIRQAIDAGLHTLHGGGGAYDIKQRLGFVLESNHFARYAVRGRWMNWLARQLA